LIYYIQAPPRIIYVPVPRSQDTDSIDNSPTPVPRSLANLYTGHREISKSLIHVIYVIDSDDSVIGADNNSNGVRQHLNSIFTSFKEDMELEAKQRGLPIPAGGINFVQSKREFLGGDVTKTKIYDYLDGLSSGAAGAKVEKDHVVFLYSLTHGRFDPATSKRYLVLNHKERGANEEIDRDELRTKLEFGLNRRLTILMTDACSSVSTNPQPSVI
jgi:hypothetical protein